MHTGYDGNKYVNAVEGKGSVSWVAYEPNQIKSATDNNGEFDSENNDTRYSVTTVHPVVIDALSDIADGKEYGTLPNAKYGEIRYPLGRFTTIDAKGRAKGGMGFLHIVEERMRKDGATLEEAIGIAAHVGMAAFAGVETAQHYNTRWLDLGGIRAIIAITDNGNAIITGYEIHADKPSGAYPSTESRLPLPPERKEEVVAALKRIIAQYHAESQVLPTTGNGQPATGNGQPSTGNQSAERSNVVRSRGVRGEDLALSYMAARMLGGKDVSVDEADKLHRSLNLATDGSELLKRGLTVI